MKYHQVRIDKNLTQLGSFIRLLHKAEQILVNCRISLFSEVAHRIEVRQLRYIASVVAMKRVERFLLHMPKRSSHTRLERFGSTHIAVPQTTESLL